MPDKSVWLTREPVACNPEPRSLRNKPDQLLRRLESNYRAFLLGCASKDLKAFSSSTLATKHCANERAQGRVLLRR